MTFVATTNGTISARAITVTADNSPRRPTTARPAMRPLRRSHSVRSRLVTQRTSFRHSQQERRDHKDGHPVRLGHRRQRRGQLHGHLRNRPDGAHHRPLRSRARGREQDLRRHDDAPPTFADGRVRHAVGGDTARFTAHVQQQERRHTARPYVPTGVFTDGNGGPTTR